MMHRNPDFGLISRVRHLTNGKETFDGFRYEQIGDSNKIRGQIKSFVATDLDGIVQQLKVFGAFRPDIENTTTLQAHVIPINQLDSVEQLGNETEVTYESDQTSIVLSAPLTDAEETSFARQLSKYEFSQIAPLKQPWKDTDPSQIQQQTDFGVISRIAYYDKGHEITTNYHFEPRRFSQGRLGSIQQYSAAILPLTASMLFAKKLTRPHLINQDIQRVYTLKEEQTLQMNVIDQQGDTHLETIVLPAGAIAKKSPLTLSEWNPLIGYISQIYHRVTRETKPQQEYRYG